MSEAQFSAQVRDLIAMLPLLGYHTYNSRRSEPGFPDWVIVGMHGVLYRELKTATGRTTKAQDEWLAWLTAAGSDATVWRPADLMSGRIWNELRVVAHGPNRT